MQNTLDETWKGLDPVVVATVIGRARARCEYRTETHHQCEAVLVYRDTGTNEMVDDQACVRIYDSSLTGDRGPSGMWWNSFATGHGDWMARTELNLLLMCPKHYEEVMIANPRKYSGKQLEGWREDPLQEEEPTPAEPVTKPRSVVFASQYMLDHYMACHRATCLCVELAGTWPTAGQLRKIMAQDGLDPNEYQVVWSIEAKTS